MQNLVLSTKPMISFKWIMMRFLKNDQQDVDNSQTNFSSMNSGSMVSNSNTVIAFQNKHQPLIQPEFKYVLPKSKVYLGTRNATSIRRRRSILQSTTFSQSVSKRYFKTQMILVQFLLMKMP
jgi:hypothetical protein